MTAVRVVVIGAGIVGAACALEALRDGHHVTLLDPAPPGGEQAASYGNGCWLSTSSVVPMTAPGLWRRVPAWLADPLGPLAIRPSYLPRALPWLWRFLRAGATEARVHAIGAALRPLLVDAPSRHLALATQAGVAHLIRRDGLLYVFPSRQDFLAERLAWEVRRAQGVRWIELDADALRQSEPALDRRYRFGVLVEEGAHCLDPGGYVAALVAYAEAQGARRVTARANGFARDGRRLRAVRADGRDIPCDRAVIAAGAWSKLLARDVGDRIPLETERGYHATIADPGIALRHAIMPSDAPMSNTLMNAGLRLAGQVEFAGLRAAPNWRRAAILRDHALRIYPGLPRDLAAERVTFWMGHRPSLPDGLPCIGPARDCPDVIHAFGHGHIGLASGAITGRLVADLLADRPPVIDPAPYLPARFSPAVSAFAHSGRAGDGAGTRVSGNAR
ncbi:MAG: FAD-binding oxidoreductase [Acetobacteraceae bacterium]|nr:FAD-binding oxidoreductase [Acetobacteraceae bacterium]